MVPSPNHRQSEIIAALRRAGGSSRIQSIAAELDVSDETIRRNIRKLVEAGLVDRLHGGARLVEEVTEADIQSRLLDSPDAKRRIASCVASMVEDGTSLFLDVGSTTAFIADALRDRHNLSIVTNSVAVAYKLATRNSNRVFFASGELRAHDGGSFGPEALAFVENFNTDLAIMSATGITADRGFLLYDLAEARFARAIMQRAVRTIVAADSRKFSRTAPVTLGDPSKVSMIVTDEYPPEDIQTAAMDWECAIRVAP